jgi:hypothetical protein
MTIVQTYFVFLPTSFFRIFSKVLKTTVYCYVVFRANEGYGVVLAKFISDHKDIILSYRL